MLYTEESGKSPNRTGFSSSPAQGETRALEEAQSGLRDPRVIVEKRI
jgi:hypothetical protein